MADPRTRAARLGPLVVAMLVGLGACGSDSDAKEGNAVEATVTVTGSPGLVQATADAIWVVTDDGVTRIDPQSNEVVATVEMERPEYIVSDGTMLWASLFDANQVVRVDPATDAVAVALEVPDNPSGAVVVGDQIWVASHRGAAVLRYLVDQPDPAATVTIGEPGPDGPLGVAAGMGSIWVGTPNIFSVSRIDPDTDEVLAEFGIPPGANPCGDIAVVDDRVQVSSCRVVASMTVIDPATGEVQVVPLEGFGVAVAVFDDEAWWAVQVAGTTPSSQLVRFDRQTGSLTAVAVPGVTAIGGVVVAFGSVWVSDEATGNVRRFPLDFLG